MHSSLQSSTWHIGLCDARTARDVARGTPCEHAVERAKGDQIYTPSWLSEPVIALPERAVLETRRFAGGGPVTNLPLATHRSPQATSHSQGRASTAVCSRVGTDDRR